MRLYIQRYIEDFRFKSRLDNSIFIYNLFTIFIVPAINQFLPKISIRIHFCVSITLIVILFMLEFTISRKKIFLVLVNVIIIAFPFSLINEELDIIIFNRDQTKNDSLDIDIIKPLIDGGNEAVIKKIDNFDIELITILRFLPSKLDKEIYENHFIPQFTNTLDRYKINNAYKLHGNEYILKSHIKHNEKYNLAKIISENKSWKYIVKYLFTDSPVDYRRMNSKITPYSFQIQKDTEKSIIVKRVELETQLESVYIAENLDCYYPGIFSENSLLYYLSRARYAFGGGTVIHYDYVCELESGKTVTLPLEDFNLTAGNEFIKINIYVYNIINAVPGGIYHIIPKVYYRHTDENKIHEKVSDDILEHSIPLYAYQIIDSTKEKIVTLTENEVFLEVDALYPAFFDEYNDIRSHIEEHMIPPERVDIKFLDLDWYEKNFNLLFFLDYTTAGVAIKKYLEMDDEIIKELFIPEDHIMKNILTEELHHYLQKKNIFIYFVDDDVIDFDRMNSIVIDNKYLIKKISDNKVLDKDSPYRNAFYHMSEENEEFLKYNKLYERFIDIDKELWGHYYLLFDGKIISDYEKIDSYVEYIELCESSSRYRIEDLGIIK